MNISKRKRYLLYFSTTVVLFLVFLATRIWRNHIIPNGLHVDEAALAYDAWSLANYGVDRHLKSWPVYLINYGGGQNVLYCYILAGLFKLFGYSQGLIRVPAIIFSLLTMVFGMLLVFHSFHRRFVYSLLTAGLIIICPYFIMAGRFGLESSLMAGMSTVFLYCFMCAMENGHYRWYVLAGITGGLVLYTYAIAYLALPLFLLLSFLYALRVKKFSVSRWLCMAIPLGILAFPLLLEQYINAFDLEEMRLGIFTITKLQGYRISEIGLPGWKNFTEVLNSIFIGDNLAYNSIPGYPNLYYVTIPLALIGLLHNLLRWGKSLKNRDFFSGVYPLFWFLAMLFVMSCVTGTNTNKVNGIFFTVVYLAVDGIYVLWRMGKCKHITLRFDRESGCETVELHKMGWCRPAAAVCLVLYAAGFLRFGVYYYLGGYSADYPTLPFFDITVSDAVEFLEEHPEYRHERTYMAQEPVYFAASHPFSPYDLMLYTDERLLMGYYYCGALTQPEDGCNYIVSDKYADYAQLLRSLGYTEVRYQCYSLFYQK